MPSGLFFNKKPPRLSLTGAQALWFRFRLSAAALILPEHPCVTSRPLHLAHMPQ